MTTNLTKPTKIGRPLAGDAPMTSTERARRSRERKKAAGVKVFQLQLEGLHLDYVQQTAEHNGVSASAVLSALLEPVLDRYVGVMRRCELMKENGATDEQVAVFMQAHLRPEPLPLLEEFSRDTGAGKS
ncbi:hypothetical protein [Duganella sp.]|uniref:hypothetical protein n=1 Tax=Duganella sp. TaxID=1904440 RepID=UPI0031E0FE95